MTKYTFLNKIKFHTILLILVFEVIAVFGIRIIVPDTTVVLKMPQNNVEWANVYYNGQIHSLDLEREKDNFKVNLNKADIDDFVIINSGERSIRLEQSNLIYNVVDCNDVMPDRYPDILILTIKNRISIKCILFVLCNLLLLFFCFLIKNKGIDRKKIYDNLLYNGSSNLKFDLKYIVVAIVIAITTCMIKPGCDLDPISRCMTLFLSGVDVYQFQYIYEVGIEDVQFLTWPYNPIMLIIYAIPSLFTFGYKPFNMIVKFNINYIIVYKVINCILLCITILSLINFLNEKGLVKNKDVKKIFMLSLYNPLVYYIAVVFIQLDVLPMYCLCIGTLLLAKKDSDILCQILCGILLAIGTTAKLQNILFLPSICLLFFILKIRFRADKKYVFGTFISLFIFQYIIIYLLNDGIGNLLSQSKQADRIWYSIFHLSQDYVIYITFFVLIFLFLSNTFVIRGNYGTHDLILNMLYINAAIVLLFSASMISTPSTLIHVLPAFVIYVSLNEDSTNILMVTILSILCVTDVIFSDIGDISACLEYFGKEPIFTRIQNQILDGKYISFLSSISKASMVAYAFLFIREAKKIIQKK